MADAMAKNGTNAEDKEIPLDNLVTSLKADPVRTVKLLINICEMAMQSQAQRWERYSRKYRRGLRYVSQSGNKSPLYSTNYMYNVVETLKANLTSSLPSLVVQPIEEGDDLAADVFTQILRVALKRAGMTRARETVVQHGAIAGSGWRKPSFDPDAFHGKGELRIDAIAPEDMLILPTSLDYRTSGLFIHRVRDVSGAQLKADYKITHIQGAPETTLIPNERGSGDSQRRMENIKTYNVYEAWVLDYETGKWWICTIAGSTLLREPEVSPYDHGRAPFVPWYDNLDVRADQAYSIGVGEIEEIEMLQDLADSLDMRIYKNIKQITGRQRVLNPASGINREDIDDSPSRVYLCTGRPADAMMWDQPPALSSEVYLYREKIEERIQIVTGLFDVTQGKKPSGIQAARAVSALQGAAAKRIEKKTEALVKSDEDLGDLCSRIITQHYTDERIIRLAGQKDIKIVGRYPEELALTDNSGLPEEQISQILTMREQWKQQAGISLVLEDINFDYDVIASTDSALPEDKGDRVQLVADLFRLGAIDRRALLEGVDYPDREKILKRLGENVTGKTPAEAMPENQAGVQGANQAKVDAATQGQIAAQAHQGQVQQAGQAQQGVITGQQQAMQQQADIIAAAQGAMKPLNSVPVR